MLNFNNASEITIDGKEAKRIEINDVVVWEKSSISIALTTSSNSVYWGQNVTLTATVSPAVEGLSVTFSNGVTATTNAEGVVTTTVNMSTPQTASFTAICSGRHSNSVSVAWNKRNINVRMLSGDLYYGHTFRIVLEDAVSGAKIPNINCHFSVNTTSSTPTKNVVSNANGYCDWSNCYMGSKTSTTSVTWNWTVDLTGNTYYNSKTGIKFSHKYQSSKKYNASLSAASTGTGCTATTSGKYYGRWYPTSDDYTLVEALKGTGTVRAYLAASGGSGACKTPEELYVKTNGKSGTSTVSGTVLAIGYYITGRRNKTVTVKFNNILIQQYSNSAWSTKATASRTTTLPYDADATYGEYTGTFSFVPTMSQLTSGYIRLVADFAANTQADLGYVYVSEFYPQVWYSPTQSFKS